MKRETKHPSRLRPFAAAAAVFAACLSARAAQTGHAVYRPGLMQARIPLGSALGCKTACTGVPVLAFNLLANVDDVRFSGPGVLSVRSVRDVEPTPWIVK